MNRLTTKNGYYKITDDMAIRGSRLVGHEFANRFNELSKQFDKVLDKLAAYENTGLEPEEILALLKSNVVMVQNGNNNTHVNHVDTLNL